MTDEQQCESVLGGLAGLVQVVEVSLVPPLWGDLRDIYRLVLSCGHYQWFAVDVPHLEVGDYVSCHECYR